VLLNLDSRDQHQELSFYHFSLIGCPYINSNEQSNLIQPNLLSTSPSTSTTMSSNYQGAPLEQKCINTIRAVSADQPQAASSGHPGAPMGCAPMAHLLWKEVMNYSASDPKWLNRDRFVLSNGHACALQYTMLHLAGYNVTLDDLKSFRKLGSTCPGHPESFMTEGECLILIISLLYVYARA
jgi:hypothetical protein